MTVWSEQNTTIPVQRHSSSRAAPRQPLLVKHIGAARAHCFALRSPSLLTVAMGDTFTHVLHINSSWTQEGVCGGGIGGFGCLVGVCMWCWAFFGLTHWQSQPLLQCATETAWQHFASVLFFWLPVLGDVWYFYLYGAGQDSNNCWSWENKTELTPLGKKTPFSTLYAHTAVSIWMFWDHSSLPTSAQLS